jgi:hypothetical protein
MKDLTLSSGERVDWKQVRALRRQQIQETQCIQQYRKKLRLSALSRVLRFDGGHGLRLFNAIHWAMVFTN